MCEPVTIGLAVASAAASMYSASEQGKAQAAAQDQAYVNNKAAAEHAAMAQGTALNQRLGEEQTAAAAEKNQNKLETMRELAKVRTSAGESGVAGAGVQSLLADVMRQNSTRTLAINRNLDNTTRQAHVDAKGIASGRQSRINSVSKSNFSSGMNFTNAALSGVSTGLSTYAGASHFTKKGK